MESHSRKKWLYTKDGYNIRQSALYGGASILLYVLLVLVFVTLFWDQTFKNGEPGLFDVDQSMWADIVSATRLRFTLWLLSFALLGILGFFACWKMRYLYRGVDINTVRSAHRDGRLFVSTCYCSFYFYYLQKNISWPPNGMLADGIQILVGAVSAVIIIFEIGRRIVERIHRRRLDAATSAPIKSTYDVNKKCESFIQKDAKTCEKAQNHVFALPAPRLSFLQLFAIFIPWATMIVSGSISISKLLEKFNVLVDCAKWFDGIISAPRFVLRVHYDGVLVLLPLIGLLLLMINNKYNAPPLLGLERNDSTKFCFPSYTMASKTLE